MDSDWGATTMSMTRADGGRALSVAMNLARWHSHPIDDALSSLRQLAMCGANHDHH